MTCILLNSLACDQQHHSPCLLCPSCWDESITSTAQFHPSVHVVPLVVPILAATHSLVYVAHVIPWVAIWAHATPFLFHSLPSRDLHVSLSPYSPSLQSCFYHEWICLSLQLCSTYVLLTTLFLHSVHRYVTSTIVHGVSCCDDVAVISWCPCLWTTWCLHG